MACFGHGGFLTALSISLFILEIKKLIIAIKSKQNKKDVITILLVWLSIVVVLTLYSLIYNHFKISRMAMFLDFVQCILACYLVRNTIDIKYILITLFIGLASSVTTAIMFELFNIYNPYTMGALSHRFGAFFPNTNTLGVYCTLCASSFIVLILNDKLQFKYYAVFPIFATIMGLLTVSKAFILITAILYATWFILSFIKSNNKKQFAIYLAVLSIGMLLSIIILQNHIRAMFIDRFVNSDYSSTLDNLTTGRVGIWSKYFNRWIKSPLTILFGNGYTASKIDTNQYEHSIYLAFLYQFGIIGTIIVIGALIWTIRKNSKLQHNVACYIPLGLFMINGLVSNLSGILCSCLIWFMALYFTTLDSNIQNANINIAEIKGDINKSDSNTDTSKKDLN
jgi:hypothetical protein